MANIYEKFQQEMEEQRKALELELEKLGNKLSNPEKLISYAVRLFANIGFVWESGDYYLKQILQHTLFWVD